VGGTETNLISQGRTTEGESNKGGGITAVQPITTRGGLKKKGCSVTEQTSEVKTTGPLPGRRTKSARGSSLGPFLKREHMTIKKKEGSGSVVGRVKRGQLDFNRRERTHEDRRKRLVGNN